MRKTRDGVILDLGSTRLDLETKADAGMRFERYVVVEAGLPRKRLEQRGHAADALVIQIGHDLRAPPLYGGSGAESENCCR